MDALGRQPSHGIDTMGYSSKPRHATSKYSSESTVTSSIYSGSMVFPSVASVRQSGKYESNHRQEEVSRLNDMVARLEHLVIEERKERELLQQQQASEARKAQEWFMQEILEIRKAQESFVQEALDGQEKRLQNAVQEVKFATVQRLPEMVQKAVNRQQKPAVETSVPLRTTKEQMPPTKQQTDTDSQSVFSAYEERIQRIEAALGSPAPCTHVKEINVPDKESGRGRKTSTPSVRARSSSSSSESTGSSSSPSNKLRRQAMRRTGSNRKHSPKLPAFKGKESWKVWYNRFRNIAARMEWSESEMLDELIPRLQGDAGTFVYEQLPEDTWNDYKKLVAELENRFRKVESTKTYQTQFNSRSQKPGESLEKFAAELKRLYDKAYPKRDQQTRKEDLLQRFYRGVYDSKVGEDVEFVRRPDDIDAAVDEMVNLIESKRNSRSDDGGNKSKRAARRAMKTSGTESEGASDSDEDPVRLVGEPAMREKNPKKQKAKVKFAKEEPRQAEAGSLTMSRKDLETIIAQILEKNNEQIMEKISHQSTTTEAKSNAEQGRRTPEYSDRSNDRNIRSNDLRRRAARTDLARIQCYKCGHMGHFARNCEAAQAIVRYYNGGRPTAEQKQTSNQRGSQWAQQSHFGDPPVFQPMSWNSQTPQAAAMVPRENQPLNP